MADARDLIRQYLADLGLTSETDWAIEQVIAGRSPEAVQIDLEARPAFQARFPGYQQLKQAGKAVSVNQWLAYETQARQVLRGAGLPEGFYDQPEDFAKFIVNDVSVAELQQRTQMAEDAVYREYDVEGARLYGLDSGDFMAMILDPTVAQPLVERKFRAAQAATVAQRSTFGALDAAQAERVGALTSSVEQAQQGFTQLAGQKDLFAAQAGESEIGADTQIAAAFGGDAAARQQVENRQRRRAAAYEQGGGVVQGQTGYVGAR